MTKRAAWPMRAAAGTTTVGTARVRDARCPAMTAAQREIFKSTGNRPSADSGFDEIADGLAPSAPPPAPGKGKTAKYRNTRCEHDGIKFDSRRERSRWFHLTQLEAAGQIRNLRLQVPFELAPAVVICGRKRPVLRYVADFVYERDGETVIEDVKGRITEGYRIKRHLMAARGLTIVEIK